MSSKCEISFHIFLTDGIKQKLTECERGELERNMSIYGLIKLKCFQILMKIVIYISFIVSVTEQDLEYFNEIALVPCHYRIFFKLGIDNITACTNAYFEFYQNSILWRE